MTDLRKAAEMALDALEKLKSHVTNNGATPEHWDAYYPMQYDALEALRTALAQPEQTKTHNLVHEIDLVLTDSESDLSEGAVRALQYVSKQLEALAQPEQEHFCDTHCVHTDHHPDCKLAQPEQDDDAYEYAKRLAECIWEKYYKEESPHWRPCHDVLGVLTQIDNMTCGLEKAQPEQEPPSECRTEGEKRAYAFGWWKALEVNRKEWVGLTDDEIYEIEEDSKDFDYLIPHLFARSIEAKLRERNGY